MALNEMYIMAQVQMSKMIKKNPKKIHKYNQWSKSRSR